MIGNDVVDLQTPEARDKASDKRFVDRVFTSQEKNWISKSAHPTQALWALWSAKESVFKVLRKLNPNLVFSHQKFEVDVPVGAVTFENTSYPVSWHINTHWIHCICIASASEGYYPYLGPWLGQWCVEKNSRPPSEESLQVRLLAQRMIAKTENLPHLEIIRKPHERGLGAPLLFSNQKQVEHIDLSLSHDGRYLAAAILRSNDPQTMRRISLADAEINNMKYIHELSNWPNF